MVDGGLYPASEGEAAALLGRRRLVEEQVGRPRALRTEDVELLETLRLRHLGGQKATPNDSVRHEAKREKKTKDAESRRTSFCQGMETDPVLNLV